jgi:hypothetical protein
VVKQDPRVKTSAIHMQQIYSLSRAAYDGAIGARQTAAQVRAMRDQIATAQPKATARLRRRSRRSTRSWRRLRVRRLRVVAAAAEQAVGRRRWPRRRGACRSCCRDTRKRGAALSA